MRYRTFPALRSLSARSASAPGTLATGWWEKKPTTKQLQCFVPLATRNSESTSSTLRQLRQRTQ